jgi:uncharacterized protein
MLKFVGLVLVVYILLCAYLFVRQRALIYYPTPVRGHAFGEVVTLPVPGAVLRLNVVKGSGTSAVIYFGGNAESVTDSAAAFARTLPERTWVLVNYRGYGGSTGTPSESTLVADALAVWDWLRPEHTDIAVVGRSLGSGVAVQLAVARPVSALVLVTPFDSLVSVGQKAFPWLPVSWLAKDRFPSVSHAPRITCPTLLLIAANDEVIDTAHARRLLTAFPAGIATAVEVSRAGHNDIQLWPNYYETIRRFVNTKA